MSKIFFFFTLILWSRGKYMQELLRFFFKNNYLSEFRFCTIQKNKNFVKRGSEKVLSN